MNTLMRLQMEFVAIQKELCIILCTKKTVKYWVDKGKGKRDLFEVGVMELDVNV